MFLHFSFIIRFPSNMEVQSLTDYFSVKLDLTQRSLLFLQGDSNLGETVSTINSNVLLLHEVKQKIEELKEIVKQWKHKVTQVSPEN